MIKFKPKAKPKWYHFREKFAFALVKLANKIKPSNDAVMCFWLQEMINDMMINGTGFGRIKSEEVFKSYPLDLN